MLRAAFPTPVSSHESPRRRCRVVAHVVAQYQNCLDWICHDASQLRVATVAPLPLVSELTHDVAMPSAEFPSDHVALVCDLQWTEEA